MKKKVSLIDDSKSKMSKTVKIDHVKFKYNGEMDRIKDTGNESSTTEKKTTLVVDASAYRQYKIRIMESEKKEMESRK